MINLHNDMVQRGLDILAMMIFYETNDPAGIVRDDQLVSAYGLDDGRVPNKTKLVAMGIGQSLDSISVAQAGFAQGDIIVPRCQSFLPPETEGCRHRADYALAGFGACVLIPSRHQPILPLRFDSMP